MTTEKLLLMLIPLTLTVIAVVLGFKSYSIALRSQIRLKYCGYYHSDREEKTRGISKTVVVHTQNNYD